MPIGHALIAILHSWQDPRLHRVRAGVRRAAEPVAGVARRRLVERLRLRRRRFRS